MRARAKAMEGVGSTDATSLVDWYVGATGLIDNRRKLIRLVNKIIRECGGGLEAKRVLGFHLSSDWRRRNARDLEYVVSQLDRYKEQLGLTGGGQATRASVERGDGFPDVVFAPLAVAVAVQRG